MSKVTPKQDLLLEVLAARYRLGESYWTFDNKHKAALQKLEAKGLVSVIHGVVENTVRAALTEKGKKRELNAEYVSPGSLGDRYASAEGSRGT